MVFGKMASLSPEQQRRQREELADRDRQASALAAAGMVAESVRIAQPAIGLQPPPPLATGSAPPVTSSTELDSINWNLMDIGNHNVDDIDMDFAAMFDPANELASMQADGTGWPASAGGNASDSVSPTPLGSMATENRDSTAGNSS